MGCLTNEETLITSLRYSLLRGDGWKRGSFPPPFPRDRKYPQPNPIRQRQRHARACYLSPEYQAARKIRAAAAEADFIIIRAAAA